MTTPVLMPREGCDRCWCGAKYWDGTTCVSCGEKWDPVVVGVIGGDAPTVERVALRFDGDVRDETSDPTLVTFSDPNTALDFVYELSECGIRAEEVVL